eukprot:TRINITY_DN575_c0_g1_i1.p1 TRINITY_DN575_c0_g1~~TRINITY_DN575_c0_g1_i1.p1  ORF type:complete len:288 (-),score=58.71 TRINITY_DN575_c0_g1_i1:452-1315(-)
MPPSGSSSGPSLNVGHLRQIKCDIDTLVEQFQLESTGVTEGEEADPVELLADFGKGLSSQIADAENESTHSLSEATAVRIQAMSTEAEVTDAISAGEAKLVLLERILRLDGLASKLGRSASSLAQSGRGGSTGGIKRDEGSDAASDEWTGAVAYTDRLKEHLNLLRLFLKREILLAKKRSVAIREAAAAAEAKVRRTSQSLSSDDDDDDDDDEEENEAASGRTKALGGRDSSSGTPHGERMSPRRSDRSHLGVNMDLDVPVDGSGELKLSASFRKQKAKIDIDEPME